ncbi:MAG: PilZ domain-containing protein [Planctomycetota bacterium]|nr:MAG: PilZ domain-containing protein [Planctomycetota bacterium]
MRTGAARGGVGHERRRHRRVPVSLAAELRLGPRRWLGRLRDLSLGGACFEPEGPEAELGAADGGEAALFAPTLGAVPIPVEVRHRQTIETAVIAVGLAFRELPRAAEAPVRERVARSE